MKDSRDQWSCFHFSQANPRGRRQSDVPALLRRVAKSIAERGEIEVLDGTWTNEVTDDGENWPSITVYYVRSG
jgi:hypothetical protein